MDTCILYGVPVAQALSLRSAADCAALERHKITPCLAIVRVGSKGDDVAYEASLVKLCRAAGIDARTVAFDSGISEQTLLDKLGDLSENDSIHGILPLLPLPEHIDVGRVRRAIAPEKDVDGVTEASLAALLTDGKRGFAPCTAEAVVELLRFYNIRLEGKNVVVLGRSAVVGKPAALLLERENATVTLCHSHTKNEAELCRRADILVAAMGKAGYIGASCFNGKQIVIDAGTNADANGVLRGDVDPNAAIGTVAAISPVPGGLGAVTSAVLINHVVEAAKRSLP